MQIKQIKGRTCGSATWPQGGPFLSNMVGQTLLRGGSRQGTAAATASVAREKLMCVVRRLVVMILSGLLATVVVLPAVASVSRPKVVDPVTHQAR